MVLPSILFWPLDLPSDRWMPETGAEAQLVSQADQGCFRSLESALGWQPCGEVSAHFKGSYWFICILENKTSFFLVEIKASRVSTPVCKL